MRTLCQVKRAERFLCNSYTFLSAAFAFVESENTSHPEHDLSPLKTCVSQETTVGLSYFKSSPGIPQIPEALPFFNFPMARATSNSVDSALLQYFIPYLKITLKKWTGSTFNVVQQFFSKHVSPFTYARCPPFCDAQYGLVDMSPAAAGFILSARLSSVRQCF